MSGDSGLPQRKGLTLGQPHDQHLTDREPIAIVGIGCRFPGGVDGPESYWDLLSAGRDALVDIPRGRWQVEKFYDPDLGPGTSRVRRGGFLTCPIDEFDAAFFGISPREADHIDPQQRLLLEVAWEALENAGTPLERLAGSDTGVFIGGFTLDYGQLQFAGTDRSNVAAHTATGVVMTMLANRISHAFNFVGPSMALDTACSSSLVAVHLACHSLWSGESSTALAGGVNLMLTPNFTIAASQGGFLSPTSRSRAFDAHADGYVRGEGAGVVVLKPLAAALRDGDQVYAVIKGTAVSQDGHTNGITVPNGESQKLAMRRALAEAGVPASSVGYVEAHGTGTPVGDPIEANAIGEVYGNGAGRPVDDDCLIASVKTNIGHLEAAAGAASLIKAALCLRHGEVPPHLHLTTLNPAIDLDALRLRIPQAAAKIGEHDGVLRAAVNSFGFGGTNAHVVLESAPVPCSPASATVHSLVEYPGRALPTVFPLSARSSGALAALAGRYAEALHSPEQIGLVAAAAAHRRTHHRQSRLAVVTRDLAELREGLECVSAGQPHPAVHVSSGLPTDSPLAFVYTGMGPQWWAMGRELYASSPVFRSAIERCDAVLAAMADWSLIDELLADEANSRMDQTAISQPANFALQVALTELWASLGIAPAAIVGHSAGEIAAAYAAGALTFDDAATVIYHRARLQHKTTGQGRLVAASISPDRARSLQAVESGLVCLAAVNSPESIALVGEVRDLEAVKAVLDGEDVFCRFVDGSVPFHSPMMDPLEAELRQCLARLAPMTPAKPIYSTVTGRQVGGAEHDAGYWWGNVRDPVRFADAALAMVDDGITTFVEVGPHPVLHRALKDCLTARSRSGLAVPSLKRGQDELATIAQSVADLYVAGYTPDWDAFYPSSVFQQLPSYPWQRERFWKEAEAVRRDRLGELDHSFLGSSRDLPLPAWRRFLDGSRPAYLADHQVMDTNLFPGAGYVEMAMAAGRELFGAPKCIAERIRFEAPVVLSGGAYELDTTIDRTTGRVAIYGRQPGSRHWVRHASARLAPAAVSAPVSNLDAIRARCTREQEGSAFYESIRGHGFGYGPAFRPIDRLWLGDGEALGQFGSDALAPSATDDLVLDPVALDGCFQMLLPLISSAVEEHAALLPVGVDQIIVHDRSYGPLWVHAEARSGVGGDLTGDATLMTSDGHAVIEVRGFRARLVGAEQQARARLGNRWLHEVTWEQADLPEGDNVPAGLWLVFADRDGMADEIANKLTAAGHSIAVARPGPAFGAVSESEFVIRPQEHRDVEQVVRSVAARSKQPVRGVIYLSPADLRSDLIGDAVPAAVNDGLKPILHLVRALDAAGLEWPLTVVTVGAQPVDGKLAAAGLLQAPLWGMTRVLHQESLALRARMLDLDPARPADHVTAAVTEILRVAPAEDQVAWRGGLRLVARLQPSRRETGSIPRALRTDASYLVTGGMGSLGLLFARWLAEHGARRIVLLARSPLPPRIQWDQLPADHPQATAIAAIKQIERLGAIVETASVDIADARALSAFVSQRQADRLPPVRGIVHSAGSVQDQVMVRMTDEQLDQVLAPKVAGGWALHEAFAAEQLDFFILFSSVSSVLVTAGQGNYAAGNAFLDGLAHYRRARGLPALSVNWGPWNVGMIAQLELQPFYQRRGIDLINQDAGLEIFDDLFGSSETEQVVVSAHWPTLIASYPIVPRLIEHLGQTDDHGQDGSSDASSVADRLAAASAEEFPAVVEECCAEVIGAVLRMRLDNLPRDVPLSQLGLDSMIAVEVRIRLEQAFGIAPKVVFLLQGTTVSGVAAYLAEKCTPASGEADTADLTALLADLSPDEAQALLAQVQQPTMKGSDQ